MRANEGNTVNNIVDRLNGTYLALDAPVIRIYTATPTLAQNPEGQVWILKTGSAGDVFPGMPWMPNGNVTPTFQLQVYTDNGIKSVSLT